MSCDLHLVSAEKNECIFKTKIKSWRIRKLENIHTHTYVYVYVHIHRERERERERERSETVCCTPKTSTKLQKVELQFF